MYIGLSRILYSPDPSGGGGRLTKTQPLFNVGQDTAIPNTKKIEYLTRLLALARGVMIFSPFSNPVFNILRNPQAQVNFGCIMMNEFPSPASDEVSALIKALIMEKQEDIATILKHSNKTIILQIAQALLEDRLPFSIYTQMLKECGTKVYPQKRAFVEKEVLEFAIENNWHQDLLSKISDPFTRSCALIQMIEFFPDRGKALAIENLLDNLERSDLADKENQSLLYKLFCALQKDIPEITNEQGPQMIIDRFLTDGSQVSDETIIHLGLAYPAAVVERVAAPPLVKGLLAVGDFIWMVNLPKRLAPSAQDAAIVLSRNLGKLQPADKEKVLRAGCGFFIKQLEALTKRQLIFNRETNLGNLIFLVKIYLASMEVLHNRGLYDFSVKSFVKMALLAQTLTEVDDFLAVAGEARRKISSIIAPVSWQMLEEKTDLATRARLFIAIVMISRYTPGRHTDFQLACLRQVKQMAQKDNLPKHLSQALLDLREIQSLEDDKPFIAPAPEQRILEPDAALLAKVHGSAGLLFTRNISVAELKDIFRNGRMNANGGKTYLRLGLSHEYATAGEVITVVMKQEFWERMKDKGECCDLWQKERENQPSTPEALFERLDLRGAAGPRLDNGGLVDMKSIYTLSVENAEALFKELKSKVAFNCGLRIAADAGMTFLGRTISPDDATGFMGYFPQFETNQEIPLDLVEAILVPEHVFKDVGQALANEGERAAFIRPLLIKVESGATKAACLAGYGDVVRRGRGGGGGFEAHLGYNALKKFETLYFQFVAGCHPTQYQRQVQRILAEDQLMIYKGWIWPRTQKEKPALQRADNDWKIFVNPKEENFYAVLQIVFGVLEQYPEAIEFKVPDNLFGNWREGRPFTDSDTPKIVIYLNPEAISPVAELLYQRLTEAFPGGSGFGSAPGPSFAKPYFERNDLFYKLEVQNDQRVDIALPIERQGKAAGWNDDVIREKQIEALTATGFTPPYFYKPESATDPVES